MSDQAQVLEKNHFRQLPDFESSNLFSLAYNEEAMQLYAIFKPEGARYVYFNVDRDTVAALERAIADPTLSVGKTFNAYIKKGEFEYMRLEDVEPEEDEGIQEQVKRRIISGVEVGMLWFDNNTDVPLYDRIERGISYYQEKYNVHPYHHLEVMISDQEEVETTEFETENGTFVSLMLDKYIHPNYFLINKAQV